MNLIHFRSSTSDDFLTIKGLLAENMLPIQDIVEGKQVFLVAEINLVVIGCIGLEIFGDYGLLRSLVVTKAYRGHKIGRDLELKMKEYCKRHSIQTLYLLTNSSEWFFRKSGWSRVNRDDVPEVLRLSSQFSSICPATAVCMSFLFK